MLLVLVVPAGTTRLGAVTIAYPDIRVQVPVSEISIATVAGTKYLEFSHVTWNSGAGPLEMRPSYDAATGIARMTQALYASDGNGGWTFVTTVPIVKQPVFVPPSDYRFPMSQFGLYAATAVGGVGALVRPSPKVDFCMTPDKYVGGVPNTPNETAYPPSNCGSPNGTLGLDVGWGDKYDSTDNGENINISSVPDGAYWLRAIADPYHYLRDANVSDNVTDTKVLITGSTVSVLSQTSPVATPPTVTMTAPANGSKTSGTVTVSANATGPSPITSVQFLLDGRPLGQPDTTAPYTISWTVGATRPGTHWLSAQARDTRGFYRTAIPVSVTVLRRIGTMTIVTNTAVAGTGIVHTAPFAASAGEVLVAFVGSDGQGQTVTVSGGSVSWTRIRRSNQQAGDAEIWVAKAPSALTGVVVTSTPAIAGFDEQLTVLGITGANGVGASNATSGPSGAPFIALTSTATGSAAFAVGNDFDHAIGRTVGSGQLLLSQYVDTRTGDTYWVQAMATASTALGQQVTLNDTAPTTDQWNLAAVEVVPTVGSPATAPAVAMMNPNDGQMVSGVAAVAADARDDVGVTKLQLTVDGRPLGPSLSAPYGYAWDTRRVRNGRHQLGATVLSASGATAHAAPVTVDVENPAPEMACFIMDATASAHGTGRITTRPLHTGVPDELLLAFVAGDGPRGGAQAFTVTGGDLTWHLVARANRTGGDAEIWQATAASVLAGARFTANPAIAGRRASITVIA
ncbi:MAG: Ig-like domain-containing protein, partial [Actinomycetota bacterium]|nr:Ig-like domain-containing protein [Actinomycetota bacterium]